VIRTSRKDKLMMIFMRYQPQENSEDEWDSPEDKVVGIEEHELECFPTHGEVVVRYAHADGQPDNESVKLASARLYNESEFQLTLSR